MAADLKLLAAQLSEKFGEALTHSVEALGELTVEVRADALEGVLSRLCFDPEFGFEQLVDLCGVDYSEYGDGAWDGQRFAVVYHLLSVRHNVRVRVRVFAGDDDFPVLPSAVEIWPVANWFEREAFDLFGIIFTGHPDLRRLLTDYGFVGNPFRKDFPLSGHVEMRYDAELGRVVYQPVTVEPREVTPRVIREEHFGRH